MQNAAPLYCTIKKIQRFEDRVIWRVYGRFSRTITRDYAVFFTWDTNCSCSITGQKWDSGKCFLFRTALPTIHTENTDQLRSGLWLIEADGHCGQMSVEYDQVRLAATGIKLHAMLLLCMFRNRTLLCIALHVRQII